MLVVVQLIIRYLLWKILLTYVTKSSYSREQINVHIEVTAELVEIWKFETPLRGGLYVCVGDDTRSS